MQTLICPSCGLEKNKNLFEDSICKACFNKDKLFFDIKLKDIILCKSCGRIKEEFMWRQFAEDSFEDLIRKNIKSNLDFTLKNLDLVFSKNKLSVSLNLQVGKAICHYNVSFTPKYQYCPDCYKKISDYFEALVQIRGFGTDKQKEKEVLHLLEKIQKGELKKGNFGAYLQKFEKVNNGFDLYLGSKELARAFIREFAEKYDFEKKESPKLVGILPGGKRKTRTTFLVRKKEEKDLNDCTTNP
ncbi:MAG: hypothetical protein COT14_00100 [Candidatus Diapherotrites archaeon CG08_land_8_20_14_0_20_30_16]|nr:MAG: hypothetical protein COT14_00100 [Candidatus Diapherotrites archaeon CG08_land_8_20_14_0_20_30_16]